MNDPNPIRAHAVAPEYSIIITCFNESNSIDEFARRLFATIRTLEVTAEVVFVDDGSIDGTYARLAAIFHSEPISTAVLRLFTNSGQAAAIAAGLSVVAGRNIVLMDSDLQLDPENLPQLLRTFREGEYDVVSGYRVNRCDSMHRRFLSKLGNMITRQASGVKFRDFGCTYKVFDGRLVRAFRFGPHHVFSLVETLSRVGRWSEIPVDHHPRRFGRSGWTVGRLLDFNTDNLLTMIRRPFQYLALFAAVAGVLLVGRVLLDVVYPVTFLSQVTPGLLLNVIVVSLLIGVAIQALIGELVIRSFGSLRGTPAYVIRESIVRGSPVLDSLPSPNGEP